MARPYTGHWSHSGPHSRLHGLLDGHLLSGTHLLHLRLHTRLLGCLHRHPLLNRPLHLDRLLDLCGGLGHLAGLLCGSLDLLHRCLLLRRLHAALRLRRLHSALRLLRLHPRLLGRHWICRIIWICWHVSFCLKC